MQIHPNIFFQNMSHDIKLANIILVDLLPAGTFSRHTDEQRKRLEGAALANLKSERDFGSYDYSMKKRPKYKVGQYMT